MPSETLDLQEIADDLEAQIHECCDSDDGDAVCHRCGVRMNAVDALRAAHQERDADALSAVRRTLAFFRSVIQSGESWSATCQREYDMAMDVLEGESDGPR